MPDGAEARDAALASLGRSAFAALAAGDPQALLAPEAFLDAALTEASARRLRMLRQRPLAASPEQFRPFEETRYVGMCAEGSEPARQGGALGLRAPAWTLQRVLIVGERGDGRRLAAWVEADFAYGPERFVALVLRRVEAPRWEHSDLEIGSCDLRVPPSLLD